MGFSAKQVQALRRKLDHRHVRTREANGRELSYIEGWYAISEANRIFGFDGWNRETADSRCVLARESRGSFLAVYVAKVRITVHAEGATIVREGHGSGEGRGTSPGEVHDIALKAAETDGTKRALATFGKPFGLELYRKDKVPPLQSPADVELVTSSPPTQPRAGFHPDDMTPIPRPSHYYGQRQQNSMSALLRSDLTKAKENAGVTASLAPAAPDSIPGKIDKSQLAIAEPKRLRNKAHLKFVASQPCIVCGRQPSDPHHLRFVQPRAIGLKVSDEFTVPLCRGHHRQLHQAGNEVAWWETLKSMRWKPPNIFGNKPIHRPSVRKMAQLSYVRSCPNSGHWLTSVGCLLCATSGHCSDNVLQWKPAPFHRRSRVPSLVVSSSATAPSTCFSSMSET
ncbi:MAG: Rad52/Rad22 family DNA repair protein [Pseudolabrys sp.]